jgi:hypothetical protein
VPDEGNCYWPGHHVFFKASFLHLQIRSHEGQMDKLISGERERAGEREREGEHIEEKITLKSTFLSIPQLSRVVLRERYWERISHIKERVILKATCLSYNTY